MKKYNFSLLNTRITIDFRLAIFLIILFLFIQVGNTQIVNLPCQDETVAVEDLERKDWEAVSGSTTDHSQGSMHNFDLPVSPDDCKFISNVEIAITIFNVDLSNLTCPTPNVYYINIATGCPSFVPASCATSNLVAEPNYPNLNSVTLSYNSPPEIFQFGDNLSVDIVPVMNLTCPNGQVALSQNEIILDYEICVTVTISDATPTATVDLGNDVDVCPNGTTTIDPGAFNDYLWGPNGEITPTVSVGPGTYTLTVTDNVGCTSTDEITVNPHPDSPITFNPANPSGCDGGTVQVSVTENYTTYNWSNSLAGQTVDLSPGSYTVTITDSNLCTFESNITVGDVVSPNAGINNFITVCNDGTLTNMDAQLGGHDSGGTWSDDDLSGVNINTSPMNVDFSSLTPSTYEFTYTVSGITPCPDDNATITVQIFEENFSGTSIAPQYCPNPGTVDFYDLLGNPTLGGSFVDVNNSMINLSDGASVNLDGLTPNTYEYIYTLDPNGPCPASQTQIFITILASSEGGDNDNITVCEGAQVNLTNLLSADATAGGTFSDDDITGQLIVDIFNTNGLAGQSYDFTYNVGTSGGQCGGDMAFFTVTVESSVTSGNDATQDICEGEMVDLYNLLTGEDTGGIFSDISGNGGLTDNMLNTTGFPTGISQYQYLIGDGISCPKDSSSIFINVVSSPNLTIATDSIYVCPDICETITYNLTGTAPFSFNTSIFSENGTYIGGGINNINNNTFTITACNLTNTESFSNDTLNLLLDSIYTIRIPSIQDENCSNSFGGGEDTVFIQARDYTRFDLDTTACISDTLVINGIEFFDGNSTLMDTLSGQRCDSIVNISVTFTTADTVYFNPILCVGDSTMIGNLFYGENNLSDEIIVLNPNGCDSITIINVTFYPQVDSMLIVPLCAGDMTTINGTLYNDANLNGVDTLFNQSANGCDSIVMVQITPTTGITINRNDTLCMDESIIIGGQIFDFNNQIDQVIVNGSGCDTTINVALNFHNVEEGNIVGPFCFDYSETLNGTIYDINNRVGSETLDNASSNGCDSIVNINLMFYPNIERTIEGPFCADYSETINGIVYDMDNRVGSETLNNASSNGCDSIVNINLTFYPSIEGTLEGPFCADYSEIVNGIVYDMDNRVGSETLDNASSNGCDSIVNINLLFFPPAQSFNDENLCIGDSLFVGGAFQFINGTYEDTLQSNSGCDSLVFTSLFFTPCIFTVNITPTDDLCGDGSSGSIFIETESPVGETYSISITDDNNNEEIIQNIVGPNIGGTFNSVMPGMYTINIFDTNGTSVYTSSVTIISTNTPINGSWSVITPIGCENGMGSLLYTPTGGQAPYMYMWDDTNIGNTPTGENLIAGNYNLTITDNLGCTAETNFEFQDGVTQEITLELMDPSCESATDGSIQITNLNAQSGPYIISLNGGLVDSTYIDGLPSATYDIIITDANLCVINMTDSLVASDDIEFAQYTEEYTITVGDSITVNGIVDPGNYTYEWTTDDNSLSCTDCPLPVANPTESTSYDLVIIAENGCSQNLTVSVIVEAIEIVIEIANIFTPNADNVNDELIFDYGQDKMLIVEIFDRWGNRVFQDESTNGSISWDGIYNGSTLASGVYVFNLQISDMEGNKESKFGDIMLLR